MGKKNPVNCFAILLQNELNNDAARFTTHKKENLATLYLFQDRFEHRW